MKTLGRRSLATFLRVALRIVQVALFILTPLILFLCGVLLIKSYGVEIGWADMLGPPAPVFGWIFLVRMTVLLVCTIIIVTQLRNIFATVAAGDPFVPENAAHLRVIWITMAVGELVRYALNFVRGISAEALDIAMPESMEGDLLTISLGMWFAVLTVIVLAEVFREGSRLRQEQQLTI